MGYALFRCTQEAFRFLGPMVNPIRRFGLFLYWLIFAVYAASVPNQEEAGHQWGSVFIVWIALALAVFQLHRIIDPKNYSASSPRFGKAFGFSLLLFPIFFVMFEARGLPSVMDVPMTFAIVTATLTLICAAAETLVMEMRKR